MNLIETLDYFMNETSAYMNELSWEIREESNYELNSIESLSEEYDFNKELHDNLQQIKSVIKQLEANK